MENSNTEVPDIIAALRRFARPRPAMEQCDLCSAGLAPQHPHLIDPKSRQIVCSCDPCAILFSGQAEMRYKRIPRQIRFLADFHLTGAQWDDLMIPIEMAFFFYSTPAEKMTALYPSPAGAVESLLDLEAWAALEETNPILRGMEQDVEALLVNRTRSREEYYIAPIDECFKLVGLIRMKWQGLSGGTEAWEEIGQFFAGLKARAKIVSETSAAEVSSLKSRVRNL